MKESTTRTWILVVAPLVVAAGFFARPYVSDFTDDELMATAIGDHTGRWIATRLRSSGQWVGGALGALAHLYPGSPGEYVASVGTAAGLWVLAAQRPSSQGASR